MQDFFSSLVGQMITAFVAFIAMLSFAGITKKQSKYNTKAMSFTAISLGLALALSFVKLFHMPFGGSVTPFSMLFVILIGYWFGTAQGILAGVTYGLLQLIVGPYVVHPVQLFLDYPLAFGMLGLSGLVANKKNGIYLAVLVGMSGRFLMHVISGVIFFASYTPEGWNPVIYSMVYNISYIGVEGVLTVALLLVPQVKTAIDTIEKTARIKSVVKD